MSRLEGDTTLTALDRSGPPPPVVELAAGAQIDRFVIQRRLGAGGMGVVYAARDTELARDIALKIVRPRGAIEGMQDRLRREARAMAQLKHPNVVEVFDIGSHDGQLFIAMELVAGETLRSWVARPRPWRAVVALFAKAGRGLAAAHAERLVHRDFKPDNVVIGRDGEPQITDFGLARELDDAAVASGSGEAPRELSQVTATGSIAGTPAYMAPEQLLGERGGAAVDQFSFCVSLFEVLYGVRPFQPATMKPEVQLAEVRAGRIAKPAGGARGAPGWLHAAIVRGLAFDPAQRWPSMTALVDALERGRRRRQRAVIGAVAAVAVAVIAGSVIVAVRGRDGGAAVPGCLEVAQRGNDATTILVCRQDYARGNEPRVGVALADALRRTGQLNDAATLANELLATPVRGDALYTLGKIAGARHRPDEAERLLRLASAQHRSREQWAESAADLHGIAVASSDVIDQLVVLDQAVVDARRGGNARTEAYCHLLAAGALSELGARSAALAELERAAPLVTQASDVAQLVLVRGNVQQNLGDHAAAATAFEQAVAGAAAVTNQRVAASAQLNLAYSLAESGRLAEAARALHAAAGLDPDPERFAIRFSLEARIARHAGDAAHAARLIERAIAATDAAEDDQLFDRETERSEIALAQGELAIAEQAARRAIARGEKSEATRAPGALRSWLLADRRAPHALLFLALARRGDAAGALVAFEQRRGLDVLAGLAHGDAAPSAAQGGVAFPAAELARWLPPLGAVALARPPAEAAILDAARAASLLVLVVAQDELWRITADAGHLAIDRIGALGELAPQLDRFRAAPADRAAAGVLGALLVPAPLARPSDRALAVVLDQPLAGLPVAALWVGDRRLVAARPVVLAARAVDAGCAARPPGPHRVVAIDDALDNALDDPSAAPRARLLGAARGDLLRVVGATTSDALGASLVLRDDPLRALEIAGRTAIAAQVVLAVRDASPADATALAMAFVAAGADQVIAPVAPVTREATRRVLDRLARPQTGDLSRALAQLQAGAGGEVALGFAAFGRDTCHTP